MVRMELSQWCCQIPFKVFWLVQDVYYLKEMTSQNGIVLMVLLNSCARHGASMVGEIVQGFSSHFG